MSTISDALDQMIEAFEKRNLVLPVAVHLTAEQGDDLSKEMYEMFAEQGCPRYTNGGVYRKLQLRWPSLS